VAITFSQSANGGVGLFAAVAGNGTQRAMTSPDGITWTAETTPEYEWTGVAYGAGKFVAVSDGASGKTMYAVI